MPQTTIVIIIIFTFTFIPLILAEVARSKSLPSIEDFFVCSRNMPVFLYFFTLYATWYSTFAVVGSGTYFYSNGPVYMTTFAWNVLFAVCLFFIGRRIWFYGKSYGYITPTDFFSDIYDSKALTVLVTAVLLVFTLPYVQIQFSGGAYLIDIASGGKIPWGVAGLIFYVVMIVYLWAGGIRAVALADVFFGTLIFLTMLGAGLLLGCKAQGVDHIFAVLSQENIENVTLSHNHGYDSALMWIAMFFVTPLGAIMSPPIWIRNYSVKKEKTFYSIPLLITLAAVGYIGCFIAGNAGKVLEPGLPDSDVVIPVLITQYGGQVLTALFFCGFAAASLSTANSQIHALAAMYTIDIHKKYINKAASDKKLIYIGKWSVLSFSVLTYVLMLSGPSFIISTGLLALSGTLQLLIPVLGALFWKKSNATGAFAGLLGGVLTIVILFFFFDVESSYCGVIGIAVNAILFTVICKASSPHTDTRSKIVNYRLEFQQRNHSRE